MPALGFGIVGSERFFIKKNEELIGDYRLQQVNDLSIIEIFFSNVQFLQTPARPKFGRHYYSLTA